MYKVYLTIISLIIPCIYSICNHYYQSTGPSSTKRPFDICYHSEVLQNLKPSSYRYYCIASTPSEYGGNSVSGFTAFREDFNTFNCYGQPNQTRIVSKPYRILCEQQSPNCEILRIRQYPIINADLCTYNQSVYADDIEVIAICDNNGDESAAYFCSNEYFWTNEYLGGDCDASNLFGSSYQYIGCQNDGSTYLQILQCDFNNETESNSGCSNYWQAAGFGSSASLRPFDICYRSYRDSTTGDYSYKYICNDTIIDGNYLVNGYTVFKEFYNGVGCQGTSNATILETTIPFSIYCGGDDCDIVRYRMYNVDSNDNTTAQCDNPNDIKLLNDYVEYVHVIERCDDDGSVSDSYFCTNDYFWITSYNNDKCNNAAITGQEYFFEGCDDSDNYIEVIACNATVTTTADPTIITTDLTMATTTTTTLASDPQKTASYAYDISGYVVIGVVTILPLLIILIAYLFHRKRIGSDRPGYMSIFKFFSSIGDFYTDAIWTLSLYSDRDNNNLWFYAFIFTFGSHLLSIVIGLVFITKWRQTKTKLYIAEYATKYDKLIIISTLLSGFYATTEIITSHLFHLNALSLQITNKQRSRILNLKIINDVILENIPCLFIQYLYLQSTTTFGSLFDNGINITLLAMIFSIIAISFGALTIGVRLFNGCIDMARPDTLNQIVIEFCFKSTVPDIIKSYHIHTNYLLSDGLSVALQMEISQIQITRIQTVTDGIKIHAKFKYLDTDNTKRILNGLKDDGNELHKSVYKECTNRLKIASENTTLSILSINSKHQTKDIDDENNLEHLKRSIETTNNSQNDVPPSNTSIEINGSLL